MYALQIDERRRAYTRSLAENLAMFELCGSQAAIPFLRRDSMGLMLSRSSGCVHRTTGSCFLSLSLQMNPLRKTPPPNATFRSNGCSVSNSPNSFRQGSESLSQYDDAPP